MPDTTDQGDGFLARLAVQIFQNLLVTIEDVHIRYEEAITNPRFACGVTLKKLALQTADSKWNLQQVHDASKLFYKLVTLENLAVYWLSRPSESFCTIKSQQPEKLIKHFTKGVARSNAFKGFYLAGPISSSAKVMVNIQSKLDGSTSNSPKILLKLRIEDVPLSVTLDQYKDIIACLSKTEYMTRRAPYLKFRHNLPYKTHYKVWWRFAITCVLEDVRQRRRNWSWPHMKKHLNCVKQYVGLYATKLASKEDESLTENLEKLEDSLDVFNIILARRKAELVVSKVIIIKTIFRNFNENKRFFEQKIAADEQNNGGSWLNRLYRPFFKSNENRKDEGIVGIIKKEITSKDRRELYDAMGYDENESATTLEKQFVDKRFEFKLKRLRILLRTSRSGLTILDACLEKVQANFEQRPAVNALKATVKVSKFFVDGTPEHNEIPAIVRLLKGSILSM